MKLTTSLAVFALVALIVLVCQNREVRAMEMRVMRTWMNMN